MIVDWMMTEKYIVGLLPNSFLWFYHQCQWWPLRGWQWFQRPWIESSAVCQTLHKNYDRKRKGSQINCWMSVVEYWCSTMKLNCGLPCMTQMCVIIDCGSTTIPTVKENTVQLYQCPYLNATKFPQKPCLPYQVAIPSCARISGSFCLVRLL